MAPPVISVAAKPAAATMPLIFVDTVISRFPPFGVPFFSFWPLASGDRLPARSSEDVELAWIENDCRLLTRLQTGGGGFRQHHAQGLAAGFDRDHRHVAERLQHRDVGVEPLL